MKTAIIYYSRHHENTKKLLCEIKKHYEVTLIDVNEEQNVDLSEFDCIGFASGIYYSRFQKRLIKYAEENMPSKKNTFFIYTCGAEKKGYTEAIAAAVKKHDARILGEYGCLGFDTFGPFKLIGGIAKGHPDEAELSGAVSFYGGICGQDGAPSDK